MRPCVRPSSPSWSGDADLHNAVALNSTSFNAARMIGPAVAGLVIAAIGTGWAFLINGASFVAVLASLAFLRIAELRPSARAAPRQGSFTEGFRYVWSRPDLKAILVMLFLIGTFGMNFSDLHLDHGGQRLSRRCPAAMACCRRSWPSARWPARC